VDPASHGGHTFVHYSPPFAPVGAPAATLPTYAPATVATGSAICPPPASTYEAAMMALELESQQARIQCIKADQANIGTGRRYATHVKNYIVYWDHLQEQWFANQRSTVAIPALPIMAMKASYFLDASCETTNVYASLSPQPSTTSRNGSTRCRV